jgi:uncharacterized protein
MAPRGRMILDETARLLKGLLGNETDLITIERIVIGVFYSGVKLSDGSGGVAYTPAADLHKGSRSTLTAAERPAPVRLKGRKITNILSRNESTTLSELVRLLVMNALSSRFITSGRYSIIYDAGALDLLDLTKLGKVAMVGAIFPFVQQLKGIPNIDLSIIEQKPESLKEDELVYYVPAAEATAVLPHCDTVLITGATTANGTLEDLLARTKPGATVVVTGPTASLLPDALFKKNVTIVSGVQVADIDTALDLLSEGLEAYYLFKTCLRKINVVKP